jgi:5'-3' exonuclease
MGTFYRTIRLVENGIKPIYVFDGKPPEMKSGELSKRAERREEAQKALEKAEEAGKYIYFVHFSTKFRFGQNVVLYYCCILLFM